MPNTVIINSSEICLKGGNRRMFENRLLDNIRSALFGVGGFQVERHQASFHLVWPKPLSDKDQDSVTESLSRVFGIATFSFARRCGLDMEDIARTVLESVGDEIGPSFKIDARRSDKSYPLTSPEIGRQIGGEVLKMHPELKVDLKNPDTRILVQIGREGAFVSVNPLSGPGGLPVGSSGRLVSLLSGGIDSPVASWKMMSRGCRIILVHCHSYPYVGRESVDKVRRLAEIVGRWQGDTRLYLIPFAEIQKEIVAKGGEMNRVILYRRMMLRLAEAVARKEGALGLITGDSVGQVASQTVENILAVSAAVTMPIYRPLCGDDKETIISIASRIGTYAPSIEPHDDCCSLFVPDHPATKATVGSLDSDESSYCFADLMEAAIKSAEVVDFQHKDKVGPVA